MIDIIPDETRENYINSFLAIKVIAEKLIGTKVVWTRGKYKNRVAQITGYEINQDDGEIHVLVKTRNDIGNKFMMSNDNFHRMPKDLSYFKMYGITEILDQS